MATTTAERAVSPVRQRLLTATARLVYEHGIAATGVDAIAAAADVAKMSLYRHFPGGKDELVAAALARRSYDVIERWVEEARRLASVTAAGGRPDPIATVLAVFDVVDQQSQNPTWRGCPLLNAAAELPSEHPGRAVVLAHRQALNDVLTGLVRDAGIGQADHLGRTLVLLLDGALAGSALTPEQHPAALARTIAALLLEETSGAAPLTSPSSGLSQRLPAQGA